MSAGRTLEIRKALYQRVADLLNQEAGLRKEMSLSIWWKPQKRTGPSATAKHNTQRNAFLCNVK